jgi:hypothetical protein
VAHYRIMKRPSGVTSRLWVQTPEHPQKIHWGVSRDSDQKMPVKATPHH